MNTVNLLTTTVNTTELAHVISTGNIFITANITLLLSFIIIGNVITAYYLVTNKNNRLMIMKSNFEKIMIITFILSMITTIITSSIITQQEYSKIVNNDTTTSRISFTSQHEKPGVWDKINKQYYQALDNNADKIEKFNIQQSCYKQEELYAEDKSVLCYGNSMRPVTSEDNKYVLQPVITDKNDNNITNSFQDDYDTDNIIVKASINIKHNNHY